MFNNIIGNDKIKDILSNSIKNNKVSHSYLFIGTEGIGKKLIAEEFAKMILSNNTENNPDFKMVEPEENSLKIDQIREFQSKVAEKPILSDKKVYIINDSDKMTTEAQNCLLKTLEEPPEFVTIILIGSNENAYLSTIKSRCMIIHFEPLSNEQISNYLKNNYDKEIDDTSIISAFEGSIGKAIRLKEKQEDYKEIKNVIYNLETKDIVDILNMSEIIYKSKEEKMEILDYINIILLDLAKNKNASKYADCVKIIEDTKKRLQSNANYDMSIDNMLFNIWNMVNTN